MTRNRDFAPFLDFYREKKIIPVSQKDALTTTHLLRRNALYRGLGVTKNCVLGRSVIEFGPGTGDNAIHIASWQPREHVLVDGNPYSVKAIREKVASGILETHCEIIESEFLSFKSNRKFDFVMCEAAIPGQREPEKYLRHVAGFVAPSGLLSTTAAGSVSYLAELCRRALVPLIVGDTQAWDEVVKKLVLFFKIDLESLSGMSRPHDDWVLDNLLNPWFPGGLFGADRVIRCLDQHFEILGMSPNILQDWRWYKEIPLEARPNAAYALDEYQKWSPYLIDYRLHPVNPHPDIAQPLENLAEECVLAERQIGEDPSSASFSRFASALDDLAVCIERAFPTTARSIRDFIAGMQELQRGREDCDLGSFRSWFGRGQQYLSFVRVRVQDDVPLQSAGNSR